MSSGVVTALLKRKGQVKVWFVRDGPNPTEGGPAYILPLESCIEKVGLEKHHWLAGLHVKIRFGDQNSPPSGLTEYRHVVCEIGEPEAAATGWKAGYYRVHLSPREAIDRLGTPRKPWDT